MWPTEIYWLQVRPLGITTRRSSSETLIVCFPEEEETKTKAIAGHFLSFFFYFFLYRKLEGKTCVLICDVWAFKLNVYLAVCLSSACKYYYVRLMCSIRTTKVSSSPSPPPHPLLWNRNPSSRDYCCLGAWVDDVGGLLKWVIAL